MIPIFRHLSVTSVIKPRNNITLKISSLLKSTTSADSKTSTSKDYGFCIQPVGENDMIGPPDPVSNIRPVLFHVSAQETELEKKYRLQREEVQEWNQLFWKQHNTKFVTEREAYIKEVKSKQTGTNKNEALSADEMSVFYKKFLDKNWLVHVKYNKEWYKKNIGLLLLSFKVKVLKKMNLNSKPLQK